MEVTTISTEQTKDLAEKLAKVLRPKDIIAFEGDLGAGKTTFIRYLVAALGSINRVQSPTFVIARKYIAENFNNINVINHLDLYRLSSFDEIKDLSLDEYFNQPDALTLIEWPNIADSILPDDSIKIIITVLGENERIFDVQNLHRHF